MRHFVKHSLLIGLGVSLLNLAHATPFTFTTTSLTTMSGENYYSWDITSGLSSLKNQLQHGYQISSVTLTYYGFQFTSAGPNLHGGGQLWSELLGYQDTLAHSAGSGTGVTYSSDNDNISDAFGPNSTTGSHKQLLINKDVFSHTFTTPTTLVENLGNIAGAIALLTADILSASSFIDIGIDPDCAFKDSKICLTINTTNKPVHVPDTTATAGLLGVSFLGLLVLRRKLAFN